MTNTTALAVTVDRLASDALAAARELDARLRRDPMNRPR
jgi:hypothetical protein